jgi:hypothetical protein
MSLGDRQRKFTILIAQLIIYAYSKGYEITLGDAYRDTRLHGAMGEKKGYGHPRSYHKQRLAIDLNLFKRDEHGNMVYLITTEDHRPLGEYWKSLDPQCSWGGDFNDGNHYSYGESR